MALSRTLRLLWGLEAGGRPGPKPALTLSDIASAGVRIADAEGLGAVSMGRLAGDLGYTTMSLYRYVESKDDLVRLLIDHAYGPPDLPPAAADGWRAHLERWAGRLRDGLAEHPWILAVPISTPPLEPHQVGWMEAGLAAFDGTPLGHPERLSSLLLVDVYVRGQSALANNLKPVPDGPDPGMEWVTGLLEVLTEERFPHLLAGIRSGSLDDEGDFATEEFEFGLTTVLDGVAARIARAQARSASSGGERLSAGGSAG